MKINNLYKLIKIIQPNKMLILIGGCSGSGKNYIASKINLPLLDVDEINKEFKNVSKSLKEMKRQFEAFLNSGKSFVHVSTCSNYKGTFNKIELAKSVGYSVVFIKVNSTIKKALINVENRVKNGGHGEKINRNVVMSSKVGSDYVFNKLKDLVDFYLIINNKGVK